MPSGQRETSLRVPGRRQRLEVLYRSAAVIAVNKPPGLAVVPGRAQEDSLIGQLKAALPDADPRVVHRLDRDTSGVMLAALTAEAQRALTRQFEEGRVRKTYAALVRGRPSANAGRIALPIGPDRRHPDRVSPNTDQPKDATTRWELAEQLADFALLRCYPETGRTHQIRVHLRAAGMPLVVDPLYGHADALLLSRVKPDYHPSRRRPERPLIGRLTLHAAAIEFEDPADGSRQRAEAPLPKDFRATLSQLRKLFGLPASEHDRARI